MSDLPDIDRLWDYDRPADSERAFRNLLTSQLPVNAPASRDAAYRAELLTQIARAQALQRAFDEAHATLDAAERLLPIDATRARTRYLLERGRTFNSSGQPERARTFFVQAWDLAVAHDEDFYAVDAAHMIAITETPAEQQAWNQRALALAESSDDARARGWRGSLYNNMGWTQHDLGRYEQALELFQKALDCRRERGLADEIRSASWCVGRALRALGRLDAALRVQRALLDEYEAAGGEDGYVYEEIGECLLALGQAGDARPYLAHAHNLLARNPNLVANEAPRLRRLKDLAEQKGI